VTDPIAGRIPPPTDEVGGVCMWQRQRPLTLTRYCEFRTGGAPALLVKRMDIHPHHRNPREGGDLIIT
jgi:hypothetical protein